MSSPSLTSSSSSSSSIPFSSSPSLNNSNNLNPLLLNLHQQQISSPISTKILQIPSQQPQQQYPPQQFDQLQNFGLIPTSAFKLVNNSLQNSELTTINKTSTPCFLSEETVLQQRQLEPKQQKIELKHQQQTSQQQKQQQRSPSSSLQKNFTPTPSTSADELLGQAIIKLLQQQQQTKGEITEINGNNNIQTNIEGSNTNQANPDYSTIIAGEEVLLCKVCSDRASGFHYGIFSCEGCKVGIFEELLLSSCLKFLTHAQIFLFISNNGKSEFCGRRKEIQIFFQKHHKKYF
uniref:Nuclear receptor domain-containing protein n=1 Tax=Meloidogyne enterolobii TaxID=390850 RepID=A0A6V7X4B0_MELEN|nr:unnamed protein product [Meloidogyne enterolobii]